MVESIDKEKEKEPTNKQLGKATVNLARIMDWQIKQLKQRLEFLDYMILLLLIAIILLAYHVGVFDVLGEAIWSS
jgi:hypothetical protein